MFIKKALRKLPEYIICFWLVLTINFFLPRLLPGDSFSYLDNAESDVQVVVSPEWRKRLLSYYGLDKPLSEQYVIYLKNTLSLNFGFSTYFKGPVIDIILETLPWSLFLAVSSMTLSSFLGVILGCFAVWRRGRLDMLLQITILLSLAFPPFVIAVLSQVMFCVYFNVFPLSGATSVFIGDISFFVWATDILSHSALPILVLSISLLGGNFFITRVSLYEIIEEDYILFARTKGLSEAKVVFKHALRNALLPVVTHISLRVAYVVTGTIFIESIFSYPGLGKLIFDAISVHDYPVIQAAFFWFTVFVLLANLIADFLYPMIDPRLGDSP